MLADNEYGGGARQRLAGVGKEQFGAAADGDAHLARPELASGCDQQMSGEPDRAGVVRRPDDALSISSAELPHLLSMSFLARIRASLAIISHAVVHAWVSHPPASLVGDPATARRKPARPWGFGIRVATLFLKPLLFFFTRRTWLGLGTVPSAGGLILAVNHISQADPIVIVDFANYGLGRIPSCLAKSSLFRLPFAGQVLAAAHQIPVDRDRPEGGGALDAAVAALRTGACVIIYPEGTVTRDPDGWPMIAHTGAARLALEAGVPIYPVGQWGAQKIIVSPSAWRSRPRPRTPVTVIVGPPIDLSPWRAAPLDAAVLREATTAIMAAVAALVGRARGESPPARPPFDPRADRPTTV